MQIQAPSPVHWTTYVQTFAVIASTIGTFVYVWFTYHIMKWAVGQGKANIDLARVSVEDIRRRHDKVDAAVAEVSQYVLEKLIWLHDRLLFSSDEAFVTDIRQARDVVDEVAGRWVELQNEDISTAIRESIEETGPWLSTARHTLVTFAPEERPEFTLSAKSYMLDVLRLAAVSAARTVEKISGPITDSPTSLRLAAMRESREAAQWRLGHGPPPQSLQTSA